MLWLKGQVIASTFAGFALFWYIAEISKLIPRRLVIACLAWAMLSAISQVIDLGELTWLADKPIELRVELPFGLRFEYNEVERGPLLYAINFMGFGILVFLLATSARFFARGNRKESVALIISLCSVLGAQVLDFLVAIGMVQFIFALEYAWLATTLFIGIRRSNDFIEAAAARKALARTGKKLEETQATLSMIIDSAEDLIWSVDAESFRLLSFNRSFIEFHSRLKGFAAEAGMPDEALHASRDEAERWRRIYGSALASGGYETEGALFTSPRIFQLRVKRLDRDGAAFGLSAFAQDITERKAAADRIARSLAEKEVLLREVYHRTKNNMSVIISMLRLQANAKGDAGLKEAYGVAIDRIKSMSMAHDELYVSEDLSHIDLGAYLADLAGRLAATHAHEGPAPRLVLDISEARVGLEEAIDCGLIVNELVTNALKHAYPGEEKGEVRLSVHKDQEGRIGIEVADKGIGLAPGFDPKRDGRLGLKIVSKLTSGKLRAGLEIKDEGGVRCVISFAEGS